MRSTAMLSGLFVSALLPSASAQIYFTGALQYYANSSGGNIGGAAEYDTFVTPNTANSKFTVNGATDIAFSLSTGANTFALAGSGSGSSYQGLGLYFSSTATTITGPFSAAPNLVVVDNISSGTTFSFVTGGSLVATYGQYSGDVSYSGATSYQIGGYEVTVTGFDYGVGGNNLQLFVTAIPEPSATAAVSALGVLGAVLVRRHARRFFAGARNESAVA